MENKERSKKSNQQTKTMTRSMTAKEDLCRMDQPVMQKNSSLLEVLIKIQLDVKQTENLAVSIWMLSKE